MYLPQLDAQFYNLSLKIISEKNTSYSSQHIFTNLSVSQMSSKNYVYVISCLHKGWKDPVKTKHSLKVLACLYSLI
jgi:hypothetical protein